MVVPQRRRRRSPRFPGSERARSIALLLACALGLLMPAFHLEPDEPVAAELASDHHECSGLFKPHADETRLGAACPDGGGCDDPWHHHHPASRHDVSHCPGCSSLLERIVELAAPFEAAPALVLRVAPPAPRLPPTAERFAIALARGPPAAPSAAMAGTRGV
jgi:hypothetical protein